MRRAPGALEQAVLSQLAAADRPLTPGEVSRGLGDDLAYTTVMTVLARLAEKGVLHREKVGRGFTYALSVDSAGQAATAMHDVLQSRPDRAAVLRQFLDGLSEADGTLVRQLLLGPEPL